MNRIGVAGLGVLTALVIWSCKSEPEYAPTSEEWEYTKQALGETLLGGCQHFMDPEGAQYRIDYFANRGKWYVILVSVHNGTEGIVKPYVGFLRKGEVRFAGVDTTKILTGDFATRYEDLVAHDSCWTLIDSSANWTEESLEKLWDKSIHVTIFGVPGVVHGGINLDLKRVLEREDSTAE